jgi:hypothetical protein
MEAKEYQLGGRKSKQTVQSFFPKTINEISHPVLHSHQSSRTNTPHTMRWAMSKPPGLNLEEEGQKILLTTSSFVHGAIL